MDNLEVLLGTYIDPKQMEIQYSTNLLNLKSNLTVTEDIVSKKGILLAKKGFILTQEQKERLIEERFANIEEHISMSDIVDQEKIFQYVTNVNETLSTLGYDFNDELKLIDSLLSEIDFTSNICSKLSLFRERSGEEFNETILIAMLSTILKKSFSSDKTQLKEMFTSALFHRIGEVYIEPIPESGSLNQDQLNRIYSVPLISNLILKNSKTSFSDNILETVLSHCEFLDGSGYPRKITTNNIPLDAKILNITRTYNALIRKGNSHLNSLNILNSLSYCRVNELGNIVLPKYDSLCIDNFSKLNLENLSSDKDSTQAFNDIILNLKLQLQGISSYLSNLNQTIDNYSQKASDFKKEDLQKLNLINQSILDCNKLFASCGIFGEGREISEEFFHPSTLNEKTYKDIQNVVLPRTLSCLSFIHSGINNLSKKDELEHAISKGNFYIQNFSRILNEYKNPTFH